MMLRIFLIVLCVLTALHRGAAQDLPEAFYDQKYQDKFTFPTGISFDDAGKMYVWEKEGKIFIVDTSGQQLPQPLIDISEEVSNWKDHGLMGFALDNDFSSNGYFYLLYALDLHYYHYYGTPQYHPDSTVTWQPTIGRVTRFQADPATGYTTTLPDSRTVLLGETLENGIPLMYEFHGLGVIIMAQDGTLLVSCGDATSNAGPDLGGDSLGTMASPAIESGIITPDQNIGSYKAQYLGSYSGKILRIDAATGDGLPSNPFYDAGNPRSPQSRTWAWGLRNPYRINLRPNTGSHYPEDGDPGTLYIGDVGNGAWEELDIAPTGGLNFGWPIMEGIGVHWPYYSYTPPANQMRPNPLYGNGCDQEYFTFKDIYTNIRSNGITPPSNPCNPTIPVEDFIVGTPPTLVWSNSRWNPPTRAQVPGFGENTYLKGIDIGTSESGVEGELFDGYSALSGIFYDHDHFPELYHGKYFCVDFSGWIKVMEFDENNQLISVAPFHQFAKDIIHLALNPADGKLYYINLEGNIHQISYGGNPPPVAIIKADQYYGSSPLSVQFDATESFDSNLPLVKYEWDFGDGQSSEDPKPQHTFVAPDNQPGSFIVQLTVEDSLGARTTAEAIVSLNNTPPVATITSFKDGALYPLDQGTTLLRLAADVSDLEHSEEELTYEWRTFLHHNAHFHPEPVDFEHESFTLISPLGCEAEDYWYRIELTVRDPEGLSTHVSHEIYPYCGSPFVEWALLEAAPVEEGVLLSWETALEDSLIALEIQRSTDQLDYIHIGSVEPAGGAERYTFVDEAPVKGKNIYRVKARKLDNAYTYSNIAVTGFPTVPDLKVYPNPVRSSFTVEVKEAKASMLFFELFNEQGVLVQSSQWEAQEGTASLHQILPFNLPNGVYHYRLTNGSQQRVGTLAISQ